MVFLSPFVFQYRLGTASLTKLCTAPRSSNACFHIFDKNDFYCSSVGNKHLTSSIQVNKIIFSPFVYWLKPNLIWGRRNCHRQVHNRILVFVLVILNCWNFTLFVNEGILWKVPFADKLIVEYQSICDLGFLICKESNSFAEWKNTVRKFKWKLSIITYVPSPTRRLTATQEENFNIRELFSFQLYPPQHQAWIQVIIILFHESRRNWVKTVVL